MTHKSNETRVSRTNTHTHTDQLTKFSSMYVDENFRQTENEDNDNNNIKLLSLKLLTAREKNENFFFEQLSHHQ